MTFCPSEVSESYSYCTCLLYLVVCDVMEALMWPCVYLSEKSHGSLEHAGVMPWMTRARYIKVGVQKAKAPVTKAMAVTPRVDHTKLRLENNNKNNNTHSSLVIKDQVEIFHDMLSHDF